MKVPITKALFEADDIAALTASLESGWVAQGPRVRRFEEKVEAYTGAKHAIASTSCTSGLHLALLALGVGPGDEVIVPAFTYVATANAVGFVGAKVVFCDIVTDSFNLDVDQLESLITPRTKALIPVHEFGLAANMDRIMAIAHQHGLKVVEDAACALGAEYKGTHVGTFGDAGAFSFHPRKAVTTGEGGVLVTNDDQLAETVRILRNQGASASAESREGSAAGYLLPEFNQLGWNYRMTDIQGALGCTQMDKMDRVRDGRREWACRYHEKLAAFDWLQTPSAPEGTLHSFQSYVCLFIPEKPAWDRLDALYEKRISLMGALDEMGIQTRQGTHAVHALGYYKKTYGLSESDFPEAWTADRLSITLPLYPQMTAEEQDYVVEGLRRAAEKVL